MKQYISISIFLFALISFTTSNAQNFQKGDLIANAGIGLGSTFTFVGLGLPIGGGVEYGITDKIGVGGEIGVVSGGGLTAFYVGPKGYYHFNELLNVQSEELDVYGGISILYRSFSVGDAFFTLSSGLYPGFHVGARYYFSEKFAAYAELGNSYSWLRVGAAIKL